MSRKKNTYIALIILMGVFFLDFLSKYYVSHYLPLMNRYFMLYPYGGIAVFQDFFGIDFSIVHATNRGAAWGILSSYQYVLLVGRITLILAALVWMVFYNKNRNYSLPLALIITGAIANVVDTFFYGHVIDMLKFTFWGYEYPVFNVADSAIFVGVFWMIFATKQVEVKDKHAS